MLRRISLGSVGLVVGGVLTIVGFTAYFSGSPTLNLVGFFYGIPILLGGLALKAAELPPVNFSEATTPDVEALKVKQATSTQQQILKDVTRFRYGQSVHLDTSLSHLGLSPNDTERPDLVGIREANIDGAYALVLEFDSPFISFETWQAKQGKMETFFGPGLRVELEKLTDEEVAVALIATPDAAS